MSNKNIPLYAIKQSKQQISSQLLSVSQLDAGFGILFFKLTPPVVRNISSCLSILFSVL